MWKRAGIGYFSVMGGYGFYRGYNNLFDRQNFKAHEVLITDKVKNGLIGAFWQINPALQPVFVFGILRRAEKTLRGMPLEKIDYFD